MSTLRITVNGQKIEFNESQMEAITEAVNEAVKAEGKAVFRITESGQVGAQVIRDGEDLTDC